MRTGLQTYSSGGYKSGTWLSSPGAATDDILVPAGEVRCIPYFVSKPLVLNAIGAEATVARGQLRFGIYQDNGYTYPGNLLFDVETSTISRPNYYIATTSGSPNITTEFLAQLTNSGSKTDLGMDIENTGNIPASTYISSITSSTTAVMNNNASGTGTTFYDLGRGNTTGATTSGSSTVTTSSAFFQSRDAWGQLSRGTGAPFYASSFPTGSYVDVVNSSTSATICNSSHSSVNATYSDSSAQFQLYRSFPTSYVTLFPWSTMHAGLYWLAIMSYNYAFTVHGVQTFISNLVGSTTPTGSTNGHMFYYSQTGVSGNALPNPFVGTGVSGKQYAPRVMLQVL